MANYMYGEEVAELIENPTTTVTVDLEDYEELVERDAFLSALEAAGVDNWDGYDFAQEIFDTFNSTT